jgi:GNAT superfamily N-acetyltransferase
MPDTQIERLFVGDEDRLRQIRLRALRDAPDAFGTTFETASAWPFESWRQQLETLTTFVAVAAGLDVGMARGARHDCHEGKGGHDRKVGHEETAELISMWVAPDARRRSVGSALVAAVADWARAERYQRLVLDVTEGNSAALALYARAGFLPTGRVGSMPPPRAHLREIELALTL